MTLRVLSISTLFPNSVRPAFGRFVANQMAGLVRRGDVELVMLAPVGLPPWPLSRSEPYRALRAVPAQSEWQGVNVLHPRFLQIPGLADSNPGRLARALLPLARQLHAKRPFDLVDAQFFFPDGPAAATIARALGLPLTIKSRGSDIAFWGQRPKALRQMLAAAEQAAGMLAVSESLKQQQIALGMAADKIAVHYTGLDHQRFRPFGRVIARSALGIDAGAPLFLCPGALIAIKGQALAIEALTVLPDARLALAGSGPDEAALKDLAARLGLSDRVLFLGQVSHELLPQWLCAADAVVLPSEREGLANAWIEALACGTPLVIPDIGGAREVVSSPSAGRIAERSPAAIADALKDLLANPPESAAVAASAARFSWDANAAQLSAFFHTLAGR